MKRTQGKDKQLRDLLEVCHITEGVSTKVHGLMDKVEICRVVKEEFEQSKRYTVSILLLTNNASELEIAESSVPSIRLKAGETATGLRMKDCKIDFAQSTFFSQVIREGETVQGSTSDILDELFPLQVANLVSKTVGYRKSNTILFPLMSWGKVIGTLAVACTDLAEHLISPLRNLATHISAALTLADEDAKRKQAEVELRTTQERYRQFVENLHEGILVIDENAYTTFVNARMAEMLGYTADEMVGRHFFSLMDEHNVAIASRALERRKQGVKEQFELELLHKDGTPVYMLMEAAPITDNEDNYIGAIAGVLDITERKRTEQLLQESEKHYRLLADNVTDIIFTMDMNSRYTYVSPSVTRLSGYSVEEATGQTLQEVLTPASFEAAMNAFAEEKVLESMKEKDLTRSRTLELEMYRKDGSTFSAEVRVTALRDRDGQPVGFVGIGRDITERVQAEESLKESEEQYRSLVENFDAAIAYIDENGKYLFLNRTAAAWLNGEPEDYVGKTVYDAFPKDLADIYVERLRRVIKSGVGETIEEVVELLNRRVFSHVQPVRNRNGEITNVQIVTYDITKHNRIGKDLG